jgi:hypothetical protein
MFYTGVRHIPLIFPHAVAHIDMATSARSLRANDGFPTFWKVVSAGFVDLSSCHCYGESESMASRFPHTHKSRKADSLIIALLQWQHGILELESAHTLLMALSRKHDVSVLMELLTDPAVIALEAT